jgi:glycosyltransferase involved in cell wall biosynthesis
LADRIRILRVITWLPVGGIERRLVATLPRLDRGRFDVRVACIRERGALADELEAAGVPVHLIAFRKRWDPAALWKLARLMGEQRIDIVHGHMYRANVPATVAARLAGIGGRRPVVWGQVHNVGTWETRRQVRVDRWLCRWRAGMIAVSESVRRDVMETLGLPAARVRVITNGVDLERFRAAGVRRQAVRAEWGAAPGDVVFVFAARLVEQKRCRDFLEAFRRLQNRPGGGRLRAWVLGDGPLRGELERQAAALRAPDAVRFAGRRDDVEDFLAAADLFVLPSTREGFSNALVEAMAAGLPAIASDVGGNAEALRNGTDGLIVPASDIDQLTEAMGLLAVNADERRTMGDSAAERAEAFGIDRMIENVERLYAESMDPGL